MDPYVSAFVRYDYGSLNDLAKSALTLSSASLGFYVAFVDKVVDASKAPIIVHQYLDKAFYSLICAVGFCVIALIANCWALLSLGLSSSKPEQNLLYLPNARNILFFGRGFLLIGSGCYLYSLSTLFLAKIRVTKSLRDYGRD